MKRSGVILAGGASRRFGEPKAFASFNGRPMYQTVRDRLLRVVDELLVVSHPDLVKSFSSDAMIEVTEDCAPHQGKGPLAGIWTAFKVLQADELLVFPCDAPLVSDAYIDWLINKAVERKMTDGGVPSFHGRLHPLMGFYRKSCLGTLGDLLDSNQLRVQALIDSTTIEIFQVPNRFSELPFYNVNTKDDLYKIKREC